MEKKILLPASQSAIGRLLCFVAVLGLSWGLDPLLDPAQACLAFRSQYLHTAWLEKDPLTGDADVTIHDAETIRQEFAGSGGCALGGVFCLDDQKRPFRCPVGFSILEVKQVVVYDEIRNVPLAGLSFTKNAATGAGFFPLNTAGIPTSDGFFAPVLEDIPAHTPVALKMTLAVRPGADLQQIQSDLASSFAVGFDEADLSGHLLGTARALEPTNPVRQGPPSQPLDVPTLEPAGALCLALLLLAGGLVSLRARG